MGAQVGVRLRVLGVLNMLGPPQEGRPHIARDAQDALGRKRECGGNQFDPGLDNRGGVGSHERGEFGPQGAGFAREIKQLTPAHIMFDARQMFG